MIAYKAFWSLLSMAVFAFFSYPLRYPFVWVMLCVSVIILVCQSGCRINKRLYKLRPVIILALLPLLYVHYNRMQSEIRWMKIARKSLLGQTEKMLPEYEKLYETLNGNRLFLYNYAAELHVVGQYEKSVAIGNECSRVWADYDLQLLLADNHLKLHNYEQAETCCWKASFMCPNRFVPLYKLTELYQQIGRDGEVRELAQRLLDKEIKVPSGTIYSIKKEMKELLEGKTKQDE